MKIISKRNPDLDMTAEDSFDGRAYVSKTEVVTVHPGQTWMTRAGRFATVDQVNDQGIIVTKCLVKKNEYITAHLGKEGRKDMFENSEHDLITIVSRIEEDCFA